MEKGMKVDTSVTAEVDAAWVRRYRHWQSRLERAKELIFKRGTKVVVNCERYQGPGVVVLNSECPPDRLPVRIPNGNVWFYPLECIRAQVEVTVQLGEGK